MSNENCSGGVRAVGFYAADTTADTVVRDTFQIEWDDDDAMITVTYLEDGEALADRYDGVSIYGHWPATDALPLDVPAAQDLAEENREAYETATQHPRAVEFWAEDGTAAEYIEETFRMEWVDGNEYGVILSLDDAVAATDQVEGLHIAQHQSPFEPLPYDSGGFPMDAATAEERAEANRNTAQRH